MQALFYFYYTIYRFYYTIFMPKYAKICHVMPISVLGAENIRYPKTNVFTRFYGIFEGVPYRSYGVA